MTNTTTTTTTTTMAAVKSAMPEYFVKSLGGAFGAMSDRAEARAEFARAIVGAALQWAHSGNNAHMAFMEALPSKGVHAKRARAALALITQGPRALKGVSLKQFETYASEMFTASVAVMTPAAPAAKPEKAKPLTAVEQVLEAIEAGTLSGGDRAALNKALATTVNPAIMAI